MKTLGIIGGMSAESTVPYYQLINRAVNGRLGGNSSADLLMHSLNFESIAALQRAGDWAGAGCVLADSAKRLEAAGAQGLLLATNTMHKVAEAIEKAVDIPFLHIVDITADALAAAGIRRVALLGTRFTMSDGFYHARLNARGIEVLTPSEKRQAEIHRIIFEELCRNRFPAESKQFYADSVAELAEQGAEGVIFGCTEIGLLISQEDCPIPAFDSTVLHAEAAVEWLLAD
ncbi:MAG: aspartate/glutamate racemase family protein [Neisseria sp.]|nr:aspartate/glutamate racemase family protein [Neisseria sp.]